MKKGVLFDLDGVLIDTEGQYSIFWSRTGRKYNVGGSTFADEIKGTNLAKILDRFPEEVREEVRQAIHDYEYEMDYPLFPGALEFLCQLQERDVPAAIVTSSDNVKMNLLYSRHPEIRQYVKAVITGDQVEHSKPAPDGYIKGAADLGIDIKDCYVFEDSLQGLEAGERSGATVIGVATTNPRAKVEEMADYVIDTIADITVDRLLSITRR
ncbi:MAG: HAD family phosphatase [Lachnoclostridium sp.]|nr:HAD family phosphatase [Lachnoclostridium sp.]